MVSIIIDTNIVIIGICVNSVEPRHYNLINESTIRPKWYRPTTRHSGPMGEAYHPTLRCYGSQEHLNIPETSLLLWHVSLWDHLKFLSVNNLVLFYLIVSCWTIYVNSFLLKLRSEDFASKFIGNVIDHFSHFISIITVKLLSSFCTAHCDTHV